MEKPDRNRLIDAFIDVVLENGEPPATVYKFCKSLGIKEGEFYQHFASLQALEGRIWAQLVDDTVSSLQKDADFAAYSAREKWLAFAYTYLEALKNQRTLALERFPRGEGCLCRKRLKHMERSVTDFAQTVVDAGHEDGSIADRGRLNELYPTAFFAHVLWITQFFLDDESEGFERTDAAIEKSVHFAFDLVGTQIIDTAFDFARFLVGER